MSRVKYQIYPSLLDKFQMFMDSDIEADGFWNIDSETGEQKKTADEIAEQREQELLDAINRIPREPMEAVDKGICFNEIVDCLAKNRSSSREDVVIRSVPVIRQEGAVDHVGKPLYYDEYPTSEKCILATMNGFEFKFDMGLCKEVAGKFRGAVPQYFCQGLLDTKYGTVRLYGYADEILMDRVYDIKTTGMYSFGKFERSWQKDVYPYCLTENEELNISEFAYTVVVLTKPSSRNPVIGGKVYDEAYTYDHDAATKRLTSVVERFIEWLEVNRDRITDKKIFGDEND